MNNRTIRDKPAIAIILLALAVGTTGVSGCAALVQSCRYPGYAIKNLVVEAHATFHHDESIHKRLTRAESYLRRYGGAHRCEVTASDVFAETSTSLRKELSRSEMRKASEEKARAEREAREARARIEAETRRREEIDQTARRMGLAGVIFGRSLTDALNAILAGRVTLEEAIPFAVEMAPIDGRFRSFQVANDLALFASDTTNAFVLLRGSRERLIQGAPLRTTKLGEEWVPLRAVIVDVSEYETVSGTTNQAFVIETW